jgi:hypothetical protein
MRRICPELMEILYQRTMLPANVPTEFWPAGAQIESQREALYTEIWRATSGNVHIPYTRYMSNYDECLRLDPMWLDVTDDLLMTDSAHLWEIGIDRATVRNMVVEHREAKRNHRQRLVQLMGLEIFLREFFG